MTPTCPECGTRFRASRAGVVVPCPSCGNPVAVTEAAAAPAKERRPAVQAPEPTETKAEIPWLLAGAVVVVLILAHYALYLLITGDARSAIGELEAEHGLAVRQEAKNPGSNPPPANSPTYKAWRDERALYVASRSYTDHEAHRSLVATGLAISVLVQLAITGFALFRMNAKLKRESTRRRRA